MGYRKLDKKPISIGLLLFASLLILPPSLLANQDGQKPWRTYVLAMDWSVAKARSKCAGDSYYGKINISTNITCLIFDWRGEWGGRSFEENFPAMGAFRQRDWNGFSSGNTSGKVLDPPHAGLVGFYGDKPPIKVKIQFSGSPESPLTPEAEAMLFARIADDLGLVQYSESDDFEKKLEAEKRRIERRDKELAEEQLREEENRIKKRELEARKRAEAKEQSRPVCTEIVFTGYATVFPHHVRQVYQSDNPSELLAYNPLTCTYKEWGGRYLSGGGVINRNRMTECKGFGYFEGQRASIMDWTPDLFQIRTDVDFNAGRRPLSLFIRRADGKCTNKVEE